MGVRSKRLWGPTIVSTGNVDLYTVPDGETALVKHLGLVNNAAVNNFIALSVNSVASSSRIYTATVAPGAGPGDKDLFIVLQPGDVLKATASFATMVVTGFGAELEGVAD